MEWASTRTSKAKKTGVAAGPYPIDWESGDEQTVQAVLDRLDISVEPDAAIACSALAARANDGGDQDVVEWLRRQRFVRGLAMVTTAEVVDAIAQIVRRRRAYGPSRVWGRRAMTIHQAKNREFESVIVLWPLKVPSVLEAQRRLLYNAVTRAQGRAIVIVQDPKGTQLNGPLFVGGS